MRVLLLAGWLLIPLGAAAWHYGPGKHYQQLDAVARVLANADRLAAAEQWADAVAQYEEALKLLPAGRTADARRIRLERAKAQMLARQLPEAHAELKALDAEVAGDPAAEPALRDEVRSALASSRYYMTWLMRLEGEPREVWEPEVEAARQAYRLLAEGADASGDAAAARKHREDLESAVRLARLELSELQGLPLPSQ
jgi:hypothetical protein